MYQSQTVSKAEMGSLCLHVHTFYSFVCCVALSLSVAVAQSSWPTTFTLSQSTFEDGDTITLDVSMGTIEQQVSAENSHTIVYSYAHEDFEIDPNSPFNLVATTNSFLLRDTHWSWSATVDEEAHTLSIDLDRTDTLLFPAGYGEAFLLKGIIVTVEEINLRRAGNTPTEKLSPIIFPNPSQDWLKIQSVVPIAYMQLSDQYGKVSAQWRGHAMRPALSVSALSSGIYMLRLTDEHGDMSTHRVLVKH